MGLDIDRLVGYGDDFGMTYPKRFFKIGINRMKKHGKLTKHPHKGFRSAFKNAMNKHPPYIDDWEVEDDEGDSFDLPDYSYADYKPNFGLKDHVGAPPTQDLFSMDQLDDTKDEEAWRTAAGQEQDSETGDLGTQSGMNENPKPNESWFSNFIRNLF